MSKVRVETKPGTQTTAIVVDTNPKFDWLAALLSSIIAAALFLASQMILGSLFFGVTAWEPLRMIGAMALGQEVLLQTSVGASVILAGVGILLVASIIYGIIGLGILRPIYPLTAIIAVGVYGLILYGVDFYGWSALFPWFASYRNWAIVAGHIIFGVALGISYMSLKRTRVYVDETIPSASGI